MTTLTLLPSPLVPVERVVWRPYAALAGLQVADVGLTAVVLGIGGREQNALARVLTDLGWSGLVLLLLIKLTLVMLLYRKQTRARLASAVYTAVVVNNVLALTMYLW